MKVIQVIKEAIEGELNLMRGYWGVVLYASLAGTVASIILSILIEMSTCKSG